MTNVEKTERDKYTGFTHKKETKCEPEKKRNLSKIEKSERVILHTLCSLACVKLYIHTYDTCNLKFT